MTPTKLPKNQAAQAAVAPDVDQEDAPARPSKSSAATAAEKDLLSWLDRPEPRAQSPNDPPAPEPDAQTEMAETTLSTPDDQIAEAGDVSAEAPLEADATPDTEAPEETVASEETTVESEEDSVALGRSERRARRRMRLARLAKQEEIWRLIRPAISIRPFSLGLRTSISDEGGCCPSRAGA